MWPFTLTIFFMNRLITIDIVSYHTTLLPTHSCLEASTKVNMAALVQTFPQQTSVTMLPSRPASSGATFGSSSNSQHAGSRSPQLSRYNTPSAASHYRGLPSGPIHPYAYTGAPTLNKQQTPHLRPENRTSSAPVISHGQHHSIHGDVVYRQHHPAAGSLPNAQSFSHFPTSTPHVQDDSSISQRPFHPELNGRPMSAVNLSSPGPILAVNTTSSTRPAPDRYHRPQRRSESGSSTDMQVPRQPTSSALPSGSGMAAVGHLYSFPGQSSSSPTFHNYQSFRGHAFNPGSQTRVTSVDDMNMPRPPPDLAKRYRRRSVGSLEAAELNGTKDGFQKPLPLPSPVVQQPPRVLAPEAKNQYEVPPRLSSHTHSGSTDSVASSRSAHSSSRPSVRCPIIRCCPVY